MAAISSSISCRYGYISNGEFIEGKIFEKEFFNLYQDDYDTIYNTVSNTDEKSIDCLERALYTWLITNKADKYAGTIV